MSGARKTFGVHGAEAQMRIQRLRIGGTTIVGGRTIRKLTKTQYLLGGAMYQLVKSGGSFWLEATTRTSARYGNHEGGEGATTEMLDKAESKGKAYLRDQIQSNHFDVWMFEQLHEAEMNPETHFSADTPSSARRAAKNMLQQLGWDTSRGLDHHDALAAAGFRASDLSTAAQREIVDAFMEGFNNEREAATTVSFVTEEVLRQTEKIKKKLKRRRG